MNTAFAVLTLVVYPAPYLLKPLIQLGTQGLGQGARKSQAGALAEFRTEFLTVIIP